MQTMNDLRAGLERARGHWPRIAADTGVNYFTIARIARGVTPNPQIDTVEKLQGWVESNFPHVPSSPSPDRGSEAAA